MEVAHDIRLVEWIGERDACRVVAGLSLGEGDAFGQSQEELCSQFGSELLTWFLWHHGRGRGHGFVGQLWGFLAELIDETYSRLPHIAVVGMADATHTIDGAVVLPDEAIVHIDGPAWREVEANSHITTETEGE